MEDLDENFATKNHDHVRLSIADIDAEYISCPLYILLFWYKKPLFNFISQTVISSSLKNFPQYSESDILGNENYNETLLPQVVKEVYQLSLANC